MEKPATKKFEELLERSGIDPDDIDRVTSIGFHVGFIKNPDGEIEYTEPLPNIRFIPTLNGENPFISQAAPTKITPRRIKPVERDYDDVVSIPDIQYGFRRMPDGRYEPLHDEAAMEVTRQYCYENQPKTIVIQGDNLDVPEFGKFEADGVHFVRTFQLALDGLHKWLARLRAENPNARIVMLEGNHDIRLIKNVLRHAMELAGIRPANMPEEWGVLTIPFLLRLGELAIEWVSGYPANTYHHNDDLQFVHGHKIRSNGSTAELYTKQYNRNTIFGHVHRQEMHTRTDEDGRQITAATFGTLARIDGIVPSYNNGITSDGEFVPFNENWQQGFGHIKIYDGYTDIRPIRIFNGRAIVDGKEYNGALAS